MKHLGDISKINGAEIEPVDIITFGSPCQDLSVAGKRAGLKHEDNGDDETTRSGLFMEAVRIIKEMREKTNGEYPRFAVWENVPGAFSSNKGEDFRIVLEELVKIVEPTAVMPAVPQFGWAYADSYCGDGWSLAYRVFDAQYWGVPQRRRRIYLVADFGGQCAREILFEREGLRGYFTEGRTPWQTTPADAERSIGTNDSEGKIPYTLKIRSGCEGGGKGALIQENMSATLACNNDQYLFQPTAYGISAYESNSMKSNNPHSGIYKADTSRTLDLNGGNPACNQGGIAVVESAGFCTEHSAKSRSIGFEEEVSPTLRAGVTPACVYSVENHPNDSRVKIDESGKVQALTSRMGTGGGNVPMVMEPFCKSHRAQTADDATTWKHGEVANTLNTFDLGETRANELVVETVALEGNGQRPSHRGDGYAVTDKSYTLNSTEVHGVVYAVDQGGGKSQANVSEDMSPTLTCTHGGEPAVAYPTLTASKASFFMNTDENLASTLVATDYKDPQMVIYPIHDDVHKFVEENNADAPHQQDLLQTTDGVARTIACGTHASGSHLTKTIINHGTHYIVRRLTPTECARLQGFADRWGDIEPKTEFSDEEYRFWHDVRNTHAAINGKAVKEYTKAQILTWYNKLHTDSAEYKLWGNGIALPTALYVIQGISYVKEGTQND